jgi:catechol 2,3-dioxygenase-like lactoylglutathione lyase family enzyme
MSNAAASLASRPLAQVALTVKNMDNARGFYRDVLGLPMLFEVTGMMFFQLQGLRLLVGQARSDEQPIGGSVLYFDTPEFEDTSLALERKGVAFIGPAQTVQRTETQDLKLREFLDPDGNALAIMGLVSRLN